MLLVDVATYPFNRALIATCAHEGATLSVVDDIPRGLLYFVQQVIATLQTETPQSKSTVNYICNWISTRCDLEDVIV